MAADNTWLTLGEVIARLREAGFTESESTVRRMVDDGEIESYRGERKDGRLGHRRMSAASVDALIQKRLRRAQPSEARRPLGDADQAHQDSAPDE